MIGEAISAIVQCVTYYNTIYLILTGNMLLRKTSKTGFFLSSCGKQWRSRNTVPCII